MKIGDIETTEKVEYEDLLKNYYEKMEIIEEQDKEIERLKGLCDKYEEEHKTTFEEWKKTINIIKEVREYIENNTEEKKSWLNGIPDYRVFKGDTKDLLEILDREEK